MGARQRAQKRGKPPRDSQKGTPASQKKLNSSLHVPDLSPSTRSNALLGWQNYALSSSPGGYRGFSMGDAARNTERNASSWGVTKLRDQAISFVGAGTLHQDPEHISIRPEISQEDQEVENGSQASDQEISKIIEPTPPTTTLEPAISDEKQQESPHLEPKPVRPRSSSVSSSSDIEQIVFTGRSRGLTPNTVSNVASKKTSRLPSPAVAGKDSRKKNESALTAQNTITRSVPIVIDVKPEAGSPVVEASSSDRRILNSRLRRRGRGGQRQREIDEQEELMRDYIANMAMDDSEDGEEQHQNQSKTKARKNETFRFYDGSGEENAKVQISASVKPTSRKQLDQAMDWNSDDLEDFDDISTTDEEVDEITQVLRYRERTSGPQYLVTPLGLSMSDARWVLHEKLVSENARKEIAIFEEIQAMEFDEESIDELEEDYDEDETTDSDAEEALNDLIDHIESEDDENARILKHTARMSDEQIARALAKQEELGMGGDELMLFSGDVDDEDDGGMEDAFRNNDQFIAFSMKQHTSNRTRSKRNQRNRDSFPSAAAFADALDEDPYGGFDVMDFDRPSLRPKKKGRKSDYPFDLDLEDEELKEQLVTTWMKDRDKKARRKHEKEEARQAALLEFADRSEPAAIKAEIRRFLMQEIDTLRLVPMESSTRASVHRLAKALKLNSRSEGKDGIDKGRYPVLTKTARTPTYTIDSIWQIDSLLNTRKFFPKHPGSYKRDKATRAAAGRTAKMRRSGGGGVQGASYMNGEVVGASAPEIGAENKGRAMLEKMGWTSGMAIGAEGNKGSLEAIKHVFKVSRAGLG